MVAILLATGQNGAYPGLEEYQPVPLLPLADRPFLQHVIEALARHGVRRFEFVLSHLPEKIEACYGDGARWGCSFHYHLATSADEELRVAAGIASVAHDEVMLAHAVSLPAFEMCSVPPDSLLVHDGLWTGWARFSEGARLLLSTIPATIASAIPEDSKLHAVTACLSIETGAEFLRSQREALSGTFPDLMIAGRQTDPHIWISRNVALHPSATIVPPVYIGENCRIGKGAQIGPSAVIGSNCIVDAQSTVINSMVTPGTYIGEGLELDSVVVDRNRLVNLRLGTSLLVSETFLLGSLIERSRGRTLQRLRDRLFALVLLAMLWPLLLGVLIFLKITRRGGFAFIETIDIPAEDSPVGWNVTRVVRFETGSPHDGEFLHRFLPGLVSVLLGHIFLVGVQPRTRREIESLAPDWRALYLKSKAGLITEARVMFGSNATQDEVYTGETFYSATESGSHDLRLAVLWLRGLFARRTMPASVPLADDLKN